MSDQNQYLRCMCEANDPAANVIFVHGLSGDQSETWQSGNKDKVFWPSWYHEEFEGLAIYSLGYPASKFAATEQDLFQRATNALDYIAARELADRPIVFVCHSLGGLLVKSLLRQAKEATDAGYNQVAQATRIVVFIATPHTGASLASIGQTVMPHLVSSHVKLLANDTGTLTELNQAYRNFCDSCPHVRTVVYYETQKTLKVLIVDRSSSDPGVSKTTPIAVDRNHIDICKPADRNDSMYLGIRRHLKGLVEELSEQATNSNGAFEPADFATPSVSDRRTLLEKMIDAGRGHEYDTANDYQNRFARSYYRQGLSTSARTEHDRLLADVQQRFTTHVFLAQICKGADDKAIENAVQTLVVDPICEKYSADESLSNLTVLEALYFLTEQCLIRWDAS